MTGRCWIRDHQLEVVLADDAEVARWVVKAGHAIPRDLALATMARSHEAGIDPGSDEIGRTAVQVLDTLLRERACGVNRPARQVALEGRWCDGQGLPVTAALQSA